jgi:hypothetical protein
VFAAMVTFPSASLNWSVVIGVTFVFVVVTATPFKVSFLIHFLLLVSPEANGAARCSKVSFPAMI